SMRRDRTGTRGSQTFYREDGVVYVRPLWGGHDRTLPTVAPRPRPLRRSYQRNSRSADDESLVRVSASQSQPPALWYTNSSHEKVAGARFAYGCDLLENRFCSGNRPQGFAQRYGEAFNVGQRPSAAPAGGNAGLLYILAETLRSQAHGIVHCAGDLLGSTFL